jgi:hypothetical protein
MEIIILQEPAEITPEREGFHRWLDMFRYMIPEDGLIYDVGKSDRFDYSNFLGKFVYKTIDRSNEKSPDFVLDVENFGEDMDTDHFDPADAVICNGVMEQCGDPFSLVVGINKLLKKGSLVLMGTMSVGFPIYQTDRTRFTPFGAEQIMVDSGFEVIKSEVIHRGELPSYVFLICRKEWNA